MFKRRGAWFLLPSLGLLVAGGAACIFFTREQIHIWLNSGHGSVTDVLFRCWSFLGEGWILVLLSLLAALYRIRTGLTLLACYLLPGITAQVVKLLFFQATPRPVRYFELKGIDFELPLVPGVEVHMWKSFPSGHTAAAFGVFFGLSLILRSRIQQFLLFVDIWGGNGSTALTGPGWSIRCS
jgi:membrane-associated phospholipid phosphatase